MSAAEPEHTAEKPNMVLASVWFIALVLVWMYMLLLLVTGLSALISGREGDGFFTNLAGLGEIMVSNDPGPLIIMVFVMICLLPVTLIWLIVLLVRRAKGWRTSLWRHVGRACVQGLPAGWPVIRPAAGFPE